MNRLSGQLLVAFLALGTACAHLATPTEAQRAISPGEAVTARFTTADPVVEGRSHYHLWRLNAQPGETLVVDMRSNDLDAYIHWGVLEGGELQVLGWDDDGGDGTDARGVIEIDRRGQYAIRTTAFRSGSTGEYTLTVTRVRDAAIGAIPIRTGETRVGALRTSSQRSPEDKYYDLYLIRGTPGQDVVIDMRSNEIDAYLYGGRMDGGRWTELARDDDGGAGTDARLTARLDARGEYHVRASHFGSLRTGGYTLSVEPVRGAQAVAPIRIYVGETLSGRLQGTAPMDDGKHFDLYRIEGRAGQSVQIDMRSNDLDAYLRGGRMDGRTWTQLAWDDDGGDGTDARMVVTLDGNGEYYVRATTFWEGSTGPYTLSVTPRR